MARTMLITMVTAVKTYGAAIKATPQSPTTAQSGCNDGPSISLK
jgi:hypothetical protein